MSIVVKNVYKRFGGFQALDNVSVDVPEGSLLALLGPSGSGKTTLLRIIAGLEVADRGSVAYDGRDVTEHAARDRRVGFVFQHYALFRHMTIADNIGYGLRVRGIGKEERRRRVDELLHLIRLDGYGTRYPSQLSGGQRQRVALARALAARPAVLLLDEPFGALDAKVRAELRQWLRRLHEEIHVTSVFVTHDQEEAFEVADHVVIMNEGKVEQVGKPAEVFEHPASAFVMDFLGNVNALPGLVERGRVSIPGLGATFPAEEHHEGKSATIYVRPHDVLIEREPSSERSGEADVLHVNAAGPRARVELRLARTEELISAELSAERYAELGLRSGERVFVTARQVRLFVPEAERS